MATGRYPELMLLLGPEIAAYTAAGAGGDEGGGVAGGMSLAADAWALGCLLYFCLHGRPLHYGDTEQVC